MYENSGQKTIKITPNLTKHVTQNHHPKLKSGCDPKLSKSKFGWSEGLRGEFASHLGSQGRPEALQGLQFLFLQMRIQYFRQNIS